MNGEKAPESRGLVEFPPSSRRHAWLFGLFLAAITLIAYQPAWHAGFIWDDDRYVTENPLLTAPDGLRRIWFSLDSLSQYFPLTYTTFYMERGLWGLNPAGYHWVNLLLHAANALLVWRVLARLRVPGAWLAAALFALHPVQVESVAWITERKNVLMGLFFLLTLLAWIQFIADQSKRRWRFYAAALVLYALALLAKTTACTLPAALLLILWLEKMPVNWRRLAQVAPFVAMGIGMGLVTVWWERHHQGTQGKLFEMGLVERALIASRALWFYVGKLLWPAHLTFSYPRWTISASDPRAYGWVLGTAALGVAIWRARRWAGRSVEVAAAFFAAMLSPVLGFIMLYTFLFSFVADHYQYLACIGPMALAAAAMETGLGRVGWGKPFLQPALCAALLMALGALTWKQCGMYANAETLWQATLRLNPASWMAQCNLGNAFLEKGQVDVAIGHFQKALGINPNFAPTHFNLGVSFFQQGRLDEAITQYEKALEINPDYAEAHNDLGLAFFQQGRLDEAIRHYQKAVEIKGDMAEAHFNLGVSFFQQGRLDEAIPHYQEVLKIKPDYAEAHNNLGACLSQQGRLDEAIRHFRKALEIQPANASAQYNLGSGCFLLGRLDEAILHYQKALEIQPDYMAAQNQLAWLLAACPEASLRNGNKAVELATQADELAGEDNPDILHTLAAAFAEAGRFAEAVETAQRALRLAESQSNTGLAGQLQSELKLYQAGKPFHGPAQTH
jgi:tetratricopeptide (TPR) repeat protein